MNYRLGLGQVECSNQKGVGVSVDTNQSMRDGVGEGRFTSSNLGLCAERARKCNVLLVFSSGLSTWPAVVVLGKHGTLASVQG